jgi:3-carboxy-cis,cis-muconate cycloisomerase
MPTSVVDSPVFPDLFGEERVAAIWSDEGSTTRYLQVEAALSTVQGALGIIPKDVAERIASVCRIKNVDMDALARETASIG